MFIYLLCQPVANWAYLRTQDALPTAACSHVSRIHGEGGGSVGTPRARIESPLPPASPASRPCIYTHLLSPFDPRYSRLRDYKAIISGHAASLSRRTRRKNSRITFGDRHRALHPSLGNYRAIGRTSRCVLALRFTSLFPSRRSPPARDSPAPSSSSSSSLPFRASLSRPCDA